MYTFDWLSNQAGIRPDKTALIDVVTERRYTYYEFNQRASQLGTYLRDVMHVNPGDRVAILAYNCTEYLELLYACAKIKAIMVGLNWRLAIPELNEVLVDSEPCVLLYGPEFSETADKIANAAGIENRLELAAVDQLKPSEYEVALETMGDVQLEMPATDLSDIWYLVYTSGTTGKPKGVIQTYGTTFYNAVNANLVQCMNYNDRFLTVLPFFHTGGLNVFTNVILHQGGTAFVMRSFDVDKTMSLICENFGNPAQTIVEKATAIHGVPAIYLSLRQHAFFKQADFSPVKIWACGGAPVPEVLLKDFADKGVRICNGYGMTEVGPTALMNFPEYALSHPTAAGRLVMHMKARIVNASGQDVALGEAGELWLRGPSVTPGYWRKPDATAQSFHDGWFKTGDVARQDDDGFYYIVDRVKDMYISGGENVYPAEVENVLFGLSGIVEAAVIGVADDKWGEVGKAFVVCSEPLSDEQILNHCRAQLAGYKMPKTIQRIDALPRNALGKVQKQELRCDTDTIE